MKKTEETREKWKKCSVEEGIEEEEREMKT